ncbi:MAG TPA: Hint domain-containing protein [Chloroflexia bacterium]|nr:Hint domain-containing protein [Chloroflexia bacterium]
MDARVTLNEQELKAFKYVHELIDQQGDGMLALDLSDPLQAAHLHGLARRSGMTPERYPALFDLISRPPEQPAFDFTALVAAAQDNDDAFTDGQMVEYISQTTAGKATGRAIFTRKKPVASATVWMSVYTMLDHNVVASGMAHSYLQQTTIVETNDSTAQPYPETNDLAASVFWAISYMDGTSETSGMNNPWAFNADGDPNVLAPIQVPGREKGDLTAIVIGLSRGFNNPSNNTDIDYWFWQGQWDNLTLLVPLKGTMKFTDNIAPLNPANPMLEFGLTLKEGGTSDKMDTSPYLPFFKIDPQDPTKLNFELLPNPTDAGNAINFGNSTWVSDTRTFFTARITVALDTLGIGWSSIVSSEKPDIDLTDGVAFIKPIVYVWHCLVAGTWIAMADGSTQYVENLQVGDVVLSGGISRQVLATLAQPHYGTVYNITIENGASLTCSGTHPIMAGTGLMQASNLVVGQQIYTLSGLQSVTSITTQQQTGQGLFNIWLDPDPPGPTIITANGFEVGDYQMQVALLDQEASDPVRVRAKLPASLLQDYESHLADTARA